MKTRKRMKNNNPEVVGSNPSPATKIIQEVIEINGFLFYFVISGQGSSHDNLSEYSLFFN